MRDLRVSFPKPCDERWEGMAPTGCDRVCARCDTVVRDLSEYTFDEAEALLRANPDSCVRARIGADRVVALKPGRGMRRMLAAGASAGLLMSATPAMAGQDKPAGAIVGQIIGYARATRIVAEGPDGTLYSVQGADDGSYRIAGLPAGKYKLNFWNCNPSKPDVETIVVADRDARARTITSRSASSSSASS